MIATTIRFTTCGDIHNNLINLDKIKTFILDMKNQSKIDFAGFVGDYVSSSADLTQLNNVKSRFDALGIRYYATVGNHDVSGSNCYSSCSNTSPTHADGCIYKTTFGYFPEQYPPITDFTKDGTTFQILVPGICWSGGAYWKYDFSNTNISKTKPTIVFNHGPVLKPSGITCGAWDSLHEYAFSMKSQLDTLNLLAIYSGHIHAAGYQIINNRLYTIQDSINSSRCTGTDDKHRNIGYTKITYDPSANKATIQYKNMEYMNSDDIINKFVDPFPDTTIPTGDNLGVFYYPWTGGNSSVSPINTWRHWRDTNHNPPKTWASNYLPDIMPIFDPCNELYSSKDVNIIKRHLALMKRGHIQFVISSWWGQNSYEDQALQVIFDTLNGTCNPNKNIKFCIYYEKEGFGNPTGSEIVSDINYIKTKYTNNQYYLKIDNKPVVFVYNADAGGVADAEKWKDVRNITGIYTVLKTFSGYQNVANYADSWHQYGPSVAFGQQGNYSAFVSPGYWKYHEQPKLTREDFIRFENDVKTLASANVQFRLIETWNEWGEGTGIEPAQKIKHDDINGFTSAASSYGTKYIDILAKYFKVV